MLIKRKQLTLVLFSSAIIVIVIISTLIGYSLYIQWKEDTSAVKYRNSIHNLSAEIFKDGIDIYNVRIEFEKGSSSKMPALKGKLKNRSSKTITSIMIELSFSKPDGYVIYRDWFYPLGEEALSSSPFFSSIKRTKEVLRPGEIMSFSYLLRKCPPEAVSQLSAMKAFAKTNPDKAIKLDLSVEGVSVS